MYQPEGDVRSHRIWHVTSCHSQSMSSQTQCQSWILFYWRKLSFWWHFQIHLKNITQSRMLTEGCIKPMFNCPGEVEIWFGQVILLHDLSMSTGCQQTRTFIWRAYKLFTFSDTYSVTWELLVAWGIVCDYKLKQLQHFVGKFSTICWWPFMKLAERERERERAYTASYVFKYICWLYISHKNTDQGFRSHVYALQCTEKCFYMEATF